MSLAARPSRLSQTSLHTYVVGPLVLSPSAMQSMCQGSQRVLKGVRGLVGPDMRRIPVRQRYTSVRWRTLLECQTDRGDAPHRVVG